MRKAKTNVKENEEKKKLNTNVYIICKEEFLTLWSLLISSYVPTHI